MKSFSSHFPKSAMESLVSTKLNPTHIDERFVPALESFLVELKEEGRFNAIENSEGYDTPFIRAWNGIASEDELFQNRPKKLWEDVTNMLANKLAFNDLAGLAFRKDLPSAEEIASVYQQMVESIDQGTFPHFKISEFQSCLETGKTIAFEFQNWRCIAGMPGRGRTFTPAPLPAPPKALEVSIDFPSGHVLAADWFRIPEFTQAIKQVDQKCSKEDSLNSREGRERAVKRYAEELGFVCVNVGNSSPNLFAGDDFVVVGLGDDNPRKPFKLKDHGNVCTDLWAVTLIDRQRLVEIIAKQVPTEAAEAKVANYLQSNGVIEFRVEPGAHHLYYHGHHETFGAKLAEGFEIDGLKLGEVEAPFFLMTKQPLSPKHEMDAHEDSFPSP